MATVKIDQFHGISPRTHPSLLADGMAVTAHNCRLKSGKLVPLKMPSRMDNYPISLVGGIAKISDANSIIIWKRDDTTEFLAFGGLVDKAAGNIADDEYDRIFLSGDTCLSWDGHDNVPMALLHVKGSASEQTIKCPLPKNPLPALKAKLVTENGAVADSDNIRYTYYYQTWVDPYGYESGASEPSLNWNPNANGIGKGAYTNDALEYNDGDGVSFLALTEDEIPEGGGTLSSPTAGYKRRIYKVVTGSETGEARFVAEFDTDPWGAKTIRVKDADAGEAMPLFETAPYDLRNMLYVPGGFYVGYSPRNPKTVMFSEVGVPTSWPEAYRYDLRDNIVAIAVSTNTVFIFTDGFPCVITGTAPESMTVSMLAGPAACVSKRSVCLYKNAACYASNVGICMIASSADDGTTVTNLTDKIFTKAQWQAFNPSSCLMGQHDGALFCFFTLSDGTRKGLVIDLLESADAVTTHDEESTCLCIDDATDNLYFVRSEDAGKEAE